MAFNEQEYYNRCLNEEGCLNEEISKLMEEELAHCDGRYQESFINGFKIGFRKGFRRGVFKALFSLMHKGKISIHEAAEVAELPESEINEAYQEWLGTLELADE